MYVSPELLKTQVKYTPVGTNMHSSSLLPAPPFPLPCFLSPSANVHLLYLLIHTQKVDLYSLGIIFFEMCHAPVATLMERAKMLADIRRKEILFPPGFDIEKEKQVIQVHYVIDK